ncbi:MAG: sulfur carrier protein ThiS [Candidatus Omnitrophica bacterium]|nr:sulfur carrier protein ThiS [Candidatus Omnitrophota bacterium]MCK5260237.1 sulfur carrier protein ThiS [Candidatus Omnitrophota bacterium]
MNIILNGKPKELPDPLGLKSLVERSCKDKSPVIAELNGEIIKLPQREETALKEGDVVELVSFVGGG